MEENLGAGVGAGQIDSARRGLEAAIAAKRSQGAHIRRDALQKMGELVRKARAAGLSHARIAQALTENGLPVGKHDVACFCQEELGEVRTARRKRRKRRPKVMGAGPSVERAARPNPASDSVTKTRGDAQTQMGRSDLLGGQATAVSAGASNSRPGFRVASDADL
jgi:hypothetical protein